MRVTATLKLTVDTTDKQHIICVNCSFIIAGPFRVSLFVDLGCPQDLWTGWWGVVGSDLWKFSIWNGVMGS